METSYWWCTGHDASSENASQETKEEKNVGSKDRERSGNRANGLYPKGLGSCREETMENRFVGFRGWSSVRLNMLSEESIHTHTLFSRTRKEDMFYRHKDTGETKWELDEEEEEETTSTEDTIKILSSNEADADRKIFVSSDMKQTTEIEKRIFTRLKLVLKQLNEEIDDTSVDTLAKSVTLHFGPHISADTRQMVGHLLGSLQDIRHEISDTIVLKNLDIETLWNQYEQFIKETDALYVV